MKSKRCFSLLISLSFCLIQWNTLCCNAEPPVHHPKFLVSTFNKLVPPNSQHLDNIAYSVLVEHLKRPRPKLVVNGEPHIVGYMVFDDSLKTKTAAAANNDLNYSPMKPQNSLSSTTFKNTKTGKDQPKIVDSEIPVPKSQGQKTASVYNQYVDSFDTEINKAVQILTHYQDDLISKNAFNHHRSFPQLKFRNSHSHGGPSIYKRIKPYPRKNLATRYGYKNLNYVSSNPLVIKSISSLRPFVSSVARPFYSKNANGVEYDIVKSIEKDI